MCHKYDYTGSLQMLPPNLISLYTVYIPQTRNMGGLFMIHPFAWWRHQMEPFSASLALCVGDSPVTGEFPSQRPVTRGFDVFFVLRMNKRLTTQSWGWWFETPSCPLWRHCNKGIERLGMAVTWWQDTMTVFSYMPGGDNAMSEWVSD